MSAATNAGPWRVEVFSETDYEVRSGGYLVAKVFTDPATATKTNADLIAAAPAMLDALVLGWTSRDDFGRTFLCNCPRWGVLAQNASKDRNEDHSTQCRAGRAAIAKARGES